jgi:hypothetical protein
MTIGACRLAKQIFVWRVVLINEELIWKVEAHAAERIPIARWLIDSNRAVAVAANSQADPRERGRISREGRKIFVSDNGRRHIPRRIKRDVLPRGSRPSPRGCEILHSTCRERKTVFRQDGDDWLKPHGAQPAPERTRY